MSKSDINIGSACIKKILRSTSQQSWLVKQILLCNKQRLFNTYVLDPLSNLVRETKLTWIDKTILCDHFHPIHTHHLSL